MKPVLSVVSGGRHHSAAQDGMSASDSTARLPRSTLGGHECRRYFNAAAPQTHPNVDQGHRQRAYRHRSVRRRL